MKNKKLRAPGIIFAAVWLLWCLLGWLRIFSLPVFIIVACVLFVPVVYIVVKLWAADMLSVIAMLMILVFVLGNALTLGMDIWGIIIPFYVRIVLMLILIAGNVVLIVSFGRKRAKEKHINTPQS